MHKLNQINNKSIKIMKSMLIKIKIKSNWSVIKIIIMVNKWCEYKCMYDWWWWSLFQLIITISIEL